MAHERDVVRKNTISTLQDLKMSEQTPYMVKKLKAMEFTVPEGFDQKPFSEVRAAIENLIKLVEDTRYSIAHIVEAEFAPQIV